MLTKPSTPGISELVSGLSDKSRTVVFSSSGQHKSLYSPNMHSRTLHDTRKSRTRGATHIGWLTPHLILVAAFDPFIGQCYLLNPSTLLGRACKAQEAVCPLQKLINPRKTHTTNEQQQQHSVIFWAVKKARRRQAGSWPAFSSGLVGVCRKLLIECWPASNSQTIFRLMGARLCGVGERLRRRPPTRIGCHAHTHHMSVSCPRKASRWRLEVMCTHDCLHSHMVLVVVVVVVRLMGPLDATELLLRSGAIVVRDLVEQNFTFLMENCQVFINEDGAAVGPWPSFASLPILVGGRFRRWLRRTLVIWYPLPNLSFHVDDDVVVERWNLGHE